MRVLLSLNSEYCRIREIEIRFPKACRPTSVFLPRVAHTLFDATTCLIHCGRGLAAYTVRDGPSVKDLTFKIICYVILSLQLMAASGVARGAAFCAHPDGQVRLELVDELAACHDEQRYPDDGSSDVSETDCVDIPVSPVLTSAETAPRSADASSARLEPALPVAFAFIATPSAAAVTSSHRAELSRTVPDSARASLSSIVLVI